MYVRQGAVKRGVVDKDLIQGWAEGTLDGGDASCLLACILEQENKGSCSLFLEMGKLGNEKRGEHRDCQRWDNHPL